MFTLTSCETMREDLVYDETKKYVMNKYVAYNLEFPSKELFRKRHLTKIGNEKYHVDSYLKSSNIMGEDIKYKFSCDVTVRNESAQINKFKISFNGVKESTNEIEEMYDLELDFGE